MVVLAHVIRGIAAPASLTYKKPFLFLIGDGTLAVYIFFVVSGFALSSAYFEKGDSRILTNMALRRYPRLTIPIFFSSLLFFFALKFGLNFSRPAAVLVHSEFWLGTFFNFVPAFGDFLRFALFDVYFSYDAAHTYSPVLWTMSIELWGSMLVFGMLALFGQVYRTPIYLVSLVVLSLLKSPLIAFVFGIILADVYERPGFVRFTKLPGAIALSALMIGGSIAFSIYGGNMYGDPRLLSLAALSLVLAIAQCSPIRGLFETAVSRFLGRISFPLYLTHLLVIVTFSSFLLVYLVNHGKSIQAAVNYMVFATLPLCIVVARAFVPIETASIRIGHRFASLFERRNSVPGTAKSTFVVGPEKGR